MGIISGKYCTVCKKETLHNTYTKKEGISQETCTLCQTEREIHTNDDLLLLADRVIEGMADDIRESLYEPTDTKK